MARSAIAQLGGDPAVVPAGGRGQEVEGRRGSQCLARHPIVGRRRRRPSPARAHPARAVAARRVAPAKRSRLAWVYCTKHASGRVAAVFSKRSPQGARGDGAEHGAGEGVPAPLSRSAVATAAACSAPRRTATGSSTRGGSAFCSSRSCERACSGSRSGWAATSGWRSARSQLFHATSTGRSPAPA